MRLLRLNRIQTLVKAHRGRSTKMRIPKWMKKAPRVIFTFALLWLVTIWGIDALVGGDRIYYYESDQCLLEKVTPEGRLDRQTFICSDRPEIVDDQSYEHIHIAGPGPVKDIASK